jgi:hypothetical protein
MRQKIIFLLLLSFVLVTAAATYAAEEAILQYKFEKNKPLRYRLDMGSKATFSMPDGNVQNLNMTTYIELNQELIEANADGSFRLAIGIDKANQIVNGNSQPLQNMPPTLVTMSPNGQIIGAAASTPTPGAQQLQMIFPTTPLSEGESWIQEQKLDHPLPLLTKTKYTLVKMDSPFPGYANPVIQIQNRMQLANAETETNEKVTSETRGNLWFDGKKGCIVRSKAHSKFSFELPINIPGMVPEGAVVQVKMELQIEISLMD